MEDLKKTPHYSMTWARSIVQTHIRSHARATETVSAILGIKAEELAYLLATGSPLWQKYKDTVRSWESWSAKLPIHYTPVKQYWLEWVKLWQKSWAGTPWSLDAEPDRNIMKERSSKARLPSGEAPRGAEPEGRLPSAELFILEL